MAKKIRFPLEMEHGVEVRSVEELRENFSLARVLVYVSNGKLITWLKDRYADDIADAIEQLNMEDAELPRRVCEIFDIPYDEQGQMDLEKARERNRKLGMLKEYTTEQTFLDVVDLVAFSQDDLYDLLDEGENTIYLCGERFSIPLAKKNMRYIGINNPMVVIDSKTEVNWQEKNIVLTGVIYDEKYQAVVDRAKRLNDPPKMVHCSTQCNTADIGNYTKNSYLSFMLTPADKKAVEECYDKIRIELKDINYDIDDDIKQTQNRLITVGLIGLADDYINSL